MFYDSNLLNIPATFFFNQYATGKCLQMVMVFRQNRLIAFWRRFQVVGTKKMHFADKIMYFMPAC